MDAGNEQRFGSIDVPQPAQPVLVQQQILDRRPPPGTEGRKARE
jgi:hypothetical protein